jgi:hypothetical protein
MGDELVHRLLGHPGVHREFGRCGALDAVEPEDLQVGRP